MKKFFIILFLVCGWFGFTKAQPQDTASFTWGNARYINLNVGETTMFNGIEIQLLALENHFNQLRFGTDTLWLKVSRRTLPVLINGFRVFVADNKNVMALSDDSDVHGLLKKDALICISQMVIPLLDPNKYIFPVSFNDGFLWKMEENSHFFSFLVDEDLNNGSAKSHAGINIDLHDARGMEKHWILALENSTVIWVKDRGIDEADKEACVLLESESNPGIYYLYQHLYRRNVEVREGQKLFRGELVGTVWGDENWGHLHFSVIKSDSVPVYENRLSNVVNFFPQIYELYFGRSYSFSRSFTKGSISFAKPGWEDGNEKNLSAFEDYLGKGWVFGPWNITDKISSVMRGKEGNARMVKTLNFDSDIVCENPDNFYTYEINVRNGTYRIRAKVGDLYLPTWQEIIFEGISAGTFELEKGESKWTGEKIVKVKDGKITVQINIDAENSKVAGLSEIVFQRAN